jgi:hypothetical protein
MHVLPQCPRTGRANTLHISPAPKSDPFTVKGTAYD